MTDLLTMMQSKSLNECKDEIIRQFMSLSTHENEMKAALISSFMLQASIDTIKGINPEKFLNSMKHTLNSQIEKGEQWRHEGNMMQEHLEKNLDVVTSFENNEKEITALTERINLLLQEHDSLLRQLCIERSKKSIAEIESLIETEKDSGYST